MNTSPKPNPRSGDTESQQLAQRTGKQRGLLQTEEELHSNNLAEFGDIGRKRTIKRVTAWAGLILGLVFLVFGLIFVTDNPELETSPQGLHVVPVSEWVLGNLDAAITLVKYSDYQCARCAYYHLIVTKLVDELGGQFRFNFRHFPLRNHLNAKAAATAAEAAGRQGKFWEMHDLLLAQQEHWARKAQSEAYEIFLQFAASLDLDMNQFQEDFTSTEISDKIDNDYLDGRRAGVRSTPTFFLNGEKIMNKPPTYEGFKALILESKSKLN
ncbi:MAG: thioredoxin domain-containing protein [Candidatus Poribacteria bacterium]|nr:thioredoxin domain-containing protein [Candidatus Poribacteria bacterium]